MVGSYYLSTLYVLFFLQGWQAWGASCTWLGAGVGLTGSPAVRSTTRPQGRGHSLLTSTLVSHIFWSHDFCLIATVVHSIISRLVTFNIMLPILQLDIGICFFKRWVSRSDYWILHLMCLLWRYQINKQKIQKTFEMETCPVSVTFWNEILTYVTCLSLVAVDKQNDIKRIRKVFVDYLKYL